MSSKLTKREARALRRAAAGKGRRLVGSQKRAVKKLEKAEEVSATAPVVIPKILDAEDYAPLGGFAGAVIRGAKHVKSLWDKWAPYVAKWGPPAVSALSALLARRAGVPHVECLNATHAFGAALPATQVGTALSAVDPEAMIPTRLSEHLGEFGVATRCQGTDFVFKFDETQSYAPGDVIVEIPFHPKMVPGSRLAILADLFQRWTITAPGNFMFIFAPGSSTIRDGQIVGFWESDVYQPTLTGDAGLVHAFGTPGHKPTQVWEPQAWPWVGASDSRMTTMYVNTTGPDNRLEYPGTFKLVAATAIAAGDLTGILHMAYDMEFLLPTVVDTLIGRSVTFRANGNTNTPGPTALFNTLYRADSDGFLVNVSTVNNRVYLGFPDNLTDAQITSGDISSSLPPGTCVIVNVATKAGTSGSSTLSPGTNIVELLNSPSPLVQDGQTFVPYDNTGTGQVFQTVAYLITGPAPYIQFSLAGTWSPTADTFVSITVVSSLEIGIGIADTYNVPLIVNSARGSVQTLRRYWSSQLRAARTPVVNVDGIVSAFKRSAQLRALMKEAFMEATNDGKDDDFTTFAPAGPSRRR